MKTICAALLALGNLVPFVRFKKREKSPME